MPANDTSPDRSFQQLPDNVSGFDIGGNVFVPQPVSISSSFPGMQVVTVTGSVDRIYIQPIRGQIVAIDATAATKAVLVQSSPANAAPVGLAASVPAGSFGILISSQSGWFFSPPAPPLPQTTYDLVRDFGAKVNDPTFDTYPSMQNALNFLSALSLLAVGGGSTGLTVPPGAYYLKTGSPTLTNSRNLQILASGARFHLGIGVLFGLRFRGVKSQGENNNGLYLQGYSVVDDSGGITINTGIGTQTPPGPDEPAGVGIRLDRNEIIGTHGGIVFDVANLGDFNDLDINLPVTTGILGNVSGQGYGVALSGVHNSRIRNGNVSFTQRHGYYISKCVGIDLVSCHGASNRVQDATPNTQFGCFEIARSSQVNLIACSGDNNWHGSISIEPDESDLTNACRGINVIGFISTNSRDEDVLIGGPSGGVGVSELSDVSIIGGYFARPTGTIGGIAPDANDAPIIRIRHGVRIQIVHPEFLASNNYSVPYVPIIASALGGDITKIDDVTVTGVRGKITGTAGLNFVYFYPPACGGVSVQKYTITDNPITITGAGANPFAFYNGGRTNPNIILERNGNTRVVALTQAATVTPDTSAGTVWQSLPVTTNAALTIDNPGVVHQGAELKLVIANTSGGAMATPVWNGVFAIDTSGGAGAFVKPANGLTVVVPFVYVGTKYVQSGACSIGV